MRLFKNWDWEHAWAGLFFTVVILAITLLGWWIPKDAKLLGYHYEGCRGGYSSADVKHVISVVIDYAPDEYLYIDADDMDYWEVLNFVDSLNTKLVEGGDSTNE